MNKQAIHHLPDSSYAHALTETRICLRLRAAKGDISECIAYLGNKVDPGQRMKVTPSRMMRVASDRFFDYFEAIIDTPFNRICYYFWLTDGVEDYYYYPGNLTHNSNAPRHAYFQLPYIRREDIARVPEWAKKAVIYQIFPDSFATSGGYISCKTGYRVTKDEEICESKLGGTINGITANISYLKDLGINCLYLNPIFAAGAYHKYDTIDYYFIDPCFGTMDDFKEMVKLCHDNGIRVILDGVFNHSGWKFSAFKDVCEKGEKSAYKDWFYRLEFPVNTRSLNYEAFAYVRQMPKLNTGNPEVVQYFCDVGRFWIREAGVDGWRLDVADEINHDFWRTFRKEIREEKPDALLIAEIWEDAEQWLSGDQFDSAMNYRFTDICKAFFALRELSVEDFDNALGYMLMRYKKPITEVQMNMLDSHDVPRFLCHCGEDARRLRLAALFGMTYVGIPSIFAGDEKGITGSTEAEYRSPMIWDDTAETLELCSYYKKIIKLRNRHISVFTGGVKTVLKDNEKCLYVFSRFDGDDEILVALNNSDFAQNVSIPADPGVIGGIDLLGAAAVMKESGFLKLVLPAVSGAVIALNRS